MQNIKQEPELNIIDEINLSPREEEYNNVDLASQAKVEISDFELDTNQYITNIKQEQELEIFDVIPNSDDEQQYGDDDSSTPPVKEDQKYDCDTKSDLITSKKSFKKVKLEFPCSTQQVKSVRYDIFEDIFDFSLILIKYFINNSYFRVH